MGSRYSPHRPLLITFLASDGKCACHDAVRTERDGVVFHLSRRGGLEAVNVMLSSSSTNW